MRVKSKLKYENEHRYLLRAVETYFKGTALPEGWAAGAAMVWYPYEAEADAVADCFKRYPDLTLKIMNAAWQVWNDYRSDDSDPGKVRRFLLRNVWLAREKGGSFRIIGPEDFLGTVPDPVRAESRDVQDKDIAALIFGSVASKGLDSRIQVVKRERRKLSLSSSPKSSAAPKVKTEPEKRPLKLLPNEV